MNNKNYSSLGFRCPTLWGDWHLHKWRNVQWFECSIILRNHPKLGTVLNLDYSPMEIPRFMNRAYLNSPFEGH